MHLVIIVCVLAVVGDAVVLVEQVRGVIGSVICVRVDTSRTGVGMRTFMYQFRVLYMHERVFNY